MDSLLDSFSSSYGLNAGQADDNRCELVEAGYGFASLVKQGG